MSKTWIIELKNKSFNILKTDSTSKFVIFQKNKFYIIKHIVSYKHISKNKNKK